MKDWIRLISGKFLLLALVGGSCFGTIGCSTKEQPVTVQSLKDRFEQRPLPAKK